MTEVIIVGNETDDISYTKNEVNDYFFKIQSAWHKAVSGILETSRALLEAEEKLNRSEFTALRRQLTNGNVMSSSVVSKLLGIAKNNVLTNDAYLTLLPPSYETLYLLSLKDEKELEEKIIKKEITIGTQQKDIKVLFPDTTIQKNKPSVKSFTKEVIFKGDISIVSEDARKLFIEALKGLKSEGYDIKGINIDD